MKNKKNLFYVLKRIFYFGLPIVLLYFIFKRIDFAELLSILKQANPALILLGIAIRPMQIIVGSIRWQTMGNFYAGTKLSFSYTAYHYWAGLAIGFFTPGNIGWDAYRIITVGKKLKSYASSIITIIAEKSTGLFSIIVMILFTFPLITDQLVEKREMLTKTYYIFLLILIFALLLIVFVNNLKKNRFYNDFLLFTGNLIKRFTKKLNLGSTYIKVSNDLSQSKSLLSIIKSPGVFLKALFLSISILIVSAVCSQMIFIGLGYPISFSINLFAAPIFFILFLVPISFGSLGVREGAYILLYALFGVPKEVALLVSLLNLIGLFLNNIIGALIVLNKGVKSFKVTEINKYTP